jgi:hypothetical protein
MINEVRNAVLSILNKNNYGYISPSDFNLYAANAQMEIFEEYFINYNKVINAENGRVPSGQVAGGSISGTDYADIESPIAETLEIFLKTDYLAKINTKSFSVPTVVTVGDYAYYILKILSYPNILTTGTNTSINTFQLIDAGANFLSDGISVGDIVANITTGAVTNVSSIASNTIINLDLNSFLASGDQYKIYLNVPKETEKVSVGKITMINNSNLTKPSNIFPSYTLEGEAISIYPSAINNKGQVQAVYFRFPKTPKWTYVTLVSGDPAFSQSQPDYQDFELSLSDEYKLVTKILQYCGISIRETLVTQFGMTQEQQQSQQ